MHFGQRVSDNVLNKTMGLDNAIDSNQYSNIATIFQNVSYASNFETGRINKSSISCSVQIQSFNVVFYVSNFSGFVGYLEISEDPVTLEPISSTFQNDTGQNVGVRSGNWAGHQIFENGEPTVLAAETDFTVATPSYPSTGCADFYLCSMSTWVGLEDEAGAGDSNLVQDGVDARCQSSGCTPSYFVWYQIQANSHEVSCGSSVTINGGDLIYAYVINDQFYGHSNTNYDFYILDATNGESCYSSNNSDPGFSQPIIADYIVENNRVCFIDCASLPQFGQIIFTYSDFYTSSWNWIYGYPDAPYYMGNGHYMSIGRGEICTDEVTDVATGSIVSSDGSSFTQTWLSSANTPSSNSGICWS